MADLPAPETMRTYADILRKPWVEVTKDGRRIPHSCGQICEAAAKALEVCADIKEGPR